MTKPFRHNGVLAKMREQKLAEFSAKEFQRVFKNTVSPTNCQRIALRMVINGLTLEELYSNYDPPLDK